MHTLLICCLAIQCVKVSLGCYDLFYKNYPFVGNVINIKILTESINSTKMYEWADKITISILNAGKTIQIEKFTLTSDVKKTNFKKINGSSEDQIIGVWDILTLSKFLEHIPSAIFPKARDKYSVYFLSPGACQDDLQIDLILRKFWIDFGVVESVVFAPLCAARCFIYRPFAHIENTWGLTESYTIDELTKNFSLIKNSIRNLNGYIFNVSMFDKVPLAMFSIPKFLKANPVYAKLYTTSGYAGPDAFFLAALSEYLNFQPKIECNVINNYGGVLPNGTLFGSYKDIVTGQSLLGVNTRYLIPYYADYTDITVPINQVDICVVVPKSMEKPKAIFNLQNFDHTSNCFLLLILASSTVFWYLVKQNFAIALEKSYCFLFGYPRKISSSVHNFFYMIACFACNNVILVVILGLLYKNITSVSYEQDIDTLDELLESKLSIRSFLWPYFNSSNDLIWKKLYLKKSPLSGIPPSKWYEIAAYNRNIAVVDAFSLLLNAEVKLTYTDQRGQPLLHMVRQCLASTYLTYIIQRGSPFLEIINSVLLSLSEGGFFNKWYKDVHEAAIFEKMQMVVADLKLTQALTLNDFKTSFQLIGVGWGLSIFLFVTEIFVNLLKIHK